MLEKPTLYKYGAKHKVSIPKLKNYQIKKQGKKVLLLLDSSKN